MILLGKLLVQAPLSHPELSETYVQDFAIYTDLRVFFQIIAKNLVGFFYIVPFTVCSFLVSNLMSRVAAISFLLELSLVFSLIIGITVSYKRRIIPFPIVLTAIFSLGIYVL